MSGCRGPGLCRPAVLPEGGQVSMPLGCAWLHLGSAQCCHTAQNHTYFDHFDTLPRRARVLPGCARVQHVAGCEHLCDHMCEHMCEPVCVWAVPAPDDKIIDTACQADMRAGPPRGKPRPRAVAPMDLNLVLTTIILITLQMAVSTVSASRSGSVRCRHAAALRPRIMTRRTSRGEGAASGRPPAAAAAASAAPALSARSASIWSSACSRPLPRAAVPRVRVSLAARARPPIDPAPAPGPCGARQSLGLGLALSRTLGLHLIQRLFKPTSAPQQRRLLLPCSTSTASN